MPKISYRCLAYAAPVVVVYMLVYPVWAILPGIYTNFFGLGLASVATVIVLIQVVDAITDPVVGSLSDYYKQKWGTRKIWVIGGAIGLVIFGYMLYAPIVPVNEYYFFVCLLLFTLSWTCFEIPHLSLGGELVFDLRGKVNPYSYRGVAIVLGSLLAVSIPWMFGIAFSPDALWLYLMIGMPALLIVIGIMVVGVGEEVEAVVEKNARLGPGFLRLIIMSRSLRIFLLGYYLSQLGMGVSNGLTYFYVDNYLDVIASLPMFYSFSILVGALAMMVVVIIPPTIEKKYIWAVGEALKVVAYFSTVYFIKPGMASIELWVIGLWSLSSFGFALSLSYAPSVLADIISEFKHRDNIDISSRLFSIYQFLTKSALALGGGLGFYVASLYGFDPKLESQSGSGTYGLLLASGYLPALIISISIACILANPLSNKSVFSVSGNGEKCQV